MILDKDKKILIVGLGLIGGSYAEAFSKNGYEVGAITKDESSISFAINKKIINHGMNDVKKEYVNQFDIIIFALYPHIFIDWIVRYQDYFKERAIITDVTGVKVKVVYQIQQILRSDIEFIAAHPMAGKEVYGVENSDARIFIDANYIITPTNKNTKYGIDVAKEIGRILKFKNISILTPEEHDEMIGFLSQLTHCIAISLMACKESHHLVEYTGDSFRDLTRIAKINENMWSELFLMNKEQLLLQMELFLKQFNELKLAIQNEDVCKIKKIMKISTSRRKYFDE